MSHNSILIATILISTTAAAQSTSIAPIVVEDSLVSEQNTDTIDFLKTSQSPVSDSGEFLNSINGISGKRSGGHGMDVIVRGQSKTRVNIKTDGAFIHGGCPNRMDPATSYASPDIYDQIEVQKGYQTVSEGRGGPGGTILFSKSNPNFTKEKNMISKVGLNAETNTDQAGLLADFAYGNSDRFIRITGLGNKGGSFEDGAGEEVKSEYTHSNVSLNSNYRVNSDTKITLDVEQDRSTDIDYPGMMMDSPLSMNSTARFKLNYKNFTALLGQTNVVHEMDNADRSASSLNEVATTSNTTTAKFEGTFNSKRTNYKIGLDLQNIQQNATFAQNGVDQFDMWPDAELNTIGIYGEQEYALSDSSTLTTGLRIDSINTTANATDKDYGAGMMQVSANFNYNYYYGVVAEDKSETNIGGLLRYEKEVSDSFKWNTGISRIVRTADINERYMHKWAGATKTNMRRSGNPDINPEQHLQIEVGASTKIGKIKNKTNLYHDMVTDFISMDLAKGQKGILRSDDAQIYRNVNATISGIETEFSYRINNNWDSIFNIGYTYGRNTTDERALYDIPPIEGSLGLNWNYKKWKINTTANFAATQEHIDFESGQDVTEENAGWATIDLNTTYTVNKNTTLKAGIKNLLDHEYANHVSRNDLLSNQAVRVNEPGRSIWISGVTSF
jgi:iron complex outermembrane receptor protein